jgi:ribosomal-protein-alanine N-acetyltransferase
MKPQETPRLSTKRLDLFACDASLARAAVGEPAELARLLDAVVPDEWPPELLADHLEEFAAKLEAAPEQAGWWHWCFVAKEPVDGGARRTLVGAGGFTPPDDDGSTTLGYAILPSWRGRGYATEAVGELLEWALAQPVVQRVRGVTFPNLKDSIRVMEKNFMKRVGPGPDKGSIMFEAARLDFGQTL